MSPRLDAAIGRAPWRADGSGDRTTPGGGPARPRIRPGRGLLQGPGVPTRLLDSEGARGGGRRSPGNLRAGLEGPAALRRSRCTGDLDLCHRAQHLPDGSATQAPDGILDDPDTPDAQHAEAQIASAPAEDPERDNLLRLLARLPRNQQEAVRLFYLEDRSYEAVAESLGMPLGTVKNLLHRARKRLIELARPEEVKAA